ncbi:hypothetical protein FQT01_12290 [Enterococcus faecalis]|nr:hypothetical protein [Enterococcus faecalis]
MEMSKGNYILNQVFLNFKLLNEKIIELLSKQLYHRLEYKERSFFMKKSYFERYKLIVYKFILSFNKEMRLITNMNKAHRETK